MAKRGRPPVENKPDRVTRSVTFPSDLNEGLKRIAAREERDVTSQIVKVLRDFVAQYPKDSEPGNPTPAGMSG